MPFATDIAPGRMTAYVLRTGKSLLETSESARNWNAGEVVIQGHALRHLAGCAANRRRQNHRCDGGAALFDPQAYGERERAHSGICLHQVAIAISRKQAEKPCAQVKCAIAVCSSIRRLRCGRKISRLSSSISIRSANRVTDFRAYLPGHPQALLECIGEIKVLDVNAAALTLMHASDKSQLIGSLQRDFLMKPGWICE